MPQINGQRVALREFRLEDIPVIQAWVNDPEIIRFLSWGIFPQTLRETERFVEAQMSGEDPMNRALVISLYEDEQCIGTTGCHNIDWRSRSAEFGIVIGKLDYLGKGYGTEATELVLDFSFNELNLHRVYLHVFDFNLRAIGAYQKCGFVEEGRLRDAFFREGNYHDIVVMGILEEEHRARKANSRVLG
jgi:RimJ/RimL family protein N-acetyltransferase